MKYLVFFSIFENCFLVANIVEFFALSGTPESDSREFVFIKELRDRASRLPKVPSMDSGFIFQKLLIFFYFNTLFFVPNPGRRTFLSC